MRLAYPKAAAALGVSRPPILLLALLAIGIAKLALVSGNEIVTEGSDSVGYLLFAHDWFWGYPTSPIRGPGYPLWVAVSHAVGLPLRIATELALIAGAVTFSLSLRRLSVPAFVVALICAAILFHPAAISNLDMPMSEGLFFAVMLLNLAAAVALLTENSRRRAIWLSLLFGLTYAFLLHIRVADSTLLSATAALVGLAMIVVSVARLGVSRGVLLCSGCALAGMAVVLCVNLAVFSLNYAHYGHFGYNQIVNQTQERLLRVLVRIDPGRPSPHPYIVVQNSARQAAYAASPSFASFRPLIEDAFRPRVEGSGQGGASRTGVAGEMDFSDMVGLMATLAQNFGEPALDRASDELDAAMAAGQLHSRHSFGLIVPDAATLGAVARKTFDATRQAFKAGPGPVMDDYPFYGTLFAPLYDEMAGRRQHLLRKGPLRAVLALPATMVPEGISLASNAIGFFERRGQGNPFQNTIKELDERGFGVYGDMGSATATRLPGAPDGFGGAPLADHRFYEVTFPPLRDRAFLFFLRFDVRLADGRTVQITDLEQGRIVEGTVPETGDVFAYRIDDFPLRLSEAHRYAYALQRGLFRQFDAYAGGGAMVLAAAAATALCLVGTRRSWRRSDAVPGLRAFSVCLVLGGVVVGRVAFYAAVDAALFPTSVDRHVFPAMALLYPWLLTCLAVALRAFPRGAWHMWPSLRPADPADRAPAEIKACGAKADQPP